MRFFRYYSLALLTVALACSQAVAALELDLKQGSGNGFAFSFLHDADGSGTSRNANGEKVQLAVGTNAIKVQLDTVNEVLKILGTEPDPLDHGALTSPSSETEVDANSLKFTGGVVSVKNGTYGGGYIDYKYTDGGAEKTGTFYFNDVKETGSGVADGEKPNSGSFVDPVVNIAEWGNNWMYGSFADAAAFEAEWGFLAALDPTRFGGTFFDNVSNQDTANSVAGSRLGIDLRATGAIPEPISLAVWGGLIAVFGSRRRRCLAYVRE